LTNQPHNPGTPVFPAFLKLVGRKVLLVGGGRVARAKLEALRAAGAEVTVVAPQVDVSIKDTEGVTVVQRPFEPTDLEGVWLVVSAATPEVNRAVATEAEARRLFVNAVDDPALASAYAGGVVRRGEVTVAFSTGGGAPALAGLLREALDELLPDDLDTWLTTARDLRSSWRSNGVAMDTRRPLLLEALNRIYAVKP
jgi:siroheme synthase-like protein